MTPEQIRAEYTVDASGRITNPGKFEGEPIFAPYLWQLCLEGFSDGDDGNVVMFKVPSGDELRKQFPELDSFLGGRRTVRLAENDQGFVHCW